MIDDGENNKPRTAGSQPIWLRNKYLSVINDWAANSTCFDGIPSIGRSEEWYWKLIWILSFLGLTVYCSFSLTNNVVKYFDYETTTQIKIKRQPVIEFPTVTFCNKNPFKILDSSPEADLFFERTESLVASWISQGYDSLSVMTNANYNIKLAASELNFSSDLLEEYSYNLDDMLIDCVFNSDVCSPDQFYRVYSINYGNCYQFNSGILSNGSRSELLKTIIPGRQNGLKLELFVGHPSVRYDVIKSSGIQLFVHNSSYRPSFGIEGISLGVGYEYDAVIRQLFLNRLPKPYSDCVADVKSPTSFDSSLFRSTIQLVGSYNQKYCLQICSQEYLIKKCGCWDLSMPMPVTSASVCSIDKILNCVIPEYQIFYDTDEQLKCFDQCPSECNQVSFGVKLSRGDFPSPNYANLILNYSASHPNPIRNFTSFSRIKTSVLALNVYYDDISYTQIDEYPERTIELLIGDIGGIAGLCIGVSFLTVVEIFELVYRLFHVKFVQNVVQAKRIHVAEAISTVNNDLNRFNDSEKSSNQELQTNSLGSNLKKRSFKLNRAVNPCNEALGVLIGATFRAQL